MDLIFENDHHDVVIHWSRPVALDTAKRSEHENDLLYLITVIASDGTERMLYIGQAYSQAVAFRLNQPDHRRKHSVWTKLFPNRPFRVRRGKVSFKNGKVSVARINAIEAILIYCFDSDDCLNERSRYNANIAGRYEIRNTGFKAQLPRRIGYGFYCQY